jgi:hypothetical protein
VRSALVVLLLAAAEGDPPGTVPLRLKRGETYSVEAPPGSNVLCDDLGVIAPEFAPDDKGFILRARAPGETLCGVWLAEAKPGGLYRITVVADPPDAGSRPLDGGPPLIDGGAQDGGADR